MTKKTSILGVGACAGVAAMMLGVGGCVVARPSAATEMATLADDELIGRLAEHFPIGMERTAAEALAAELGMTVWTPPPNSMENGMPVRIGDDPNEARYVLGACTIGGVTRLRGVLMRFSPEGTLEEVGFGPIVMPRRGLDPVYGLAPRAADEGRS